MKRTADTSFSSAQGSYGLTPVPGGPAARHPATSTPPGQANPQDPPSIASSTDRTGTGLLAAPALQQAAVGNATAAADDGHPDLAGMTELQVQVMIHSVGMDFLLKQKWPDSCTFLHLLAATRNSKWLEAALATEGQKQALFLRSKLDHLPLHFAVLDGSTEIVQSLLAHDDDDGSMRLARRGVAQTIPLHYACALHHDSIVVLLLSRRGEEQRLACSQLGGPPLHTALNFSNIEVVPHLLAERAIDQVLKQKNDGSNALMLAASKGVAAAVDMLLAVPDTLAAQLEARDKKGKGAIDFARLGGNAKTIALIEAAMKTVANESISSSTTATSTPTSSTTTTSTATVLLPPSNDNEPPGPLTPYPNSSDGVRRPIFPTRKTTRFDFDASTRISGMRFAHSAPPILRSRPDKLLADRHPSL